MVKFYSNTCTHSDLLLCGTAITSSFSLEKGFRQASIKQQLSLTTLPPVGDTFIFNGVHMGEDPPKNHD
jgi:hypothetical protein